MALTLSSSPSEPVPDAAGSETRVVVHTPKNSAATIDSTSATLDSISPRSRDRVDETKCSILPMSMDGDIDGDITAGGSDTDNASVRVQNMEDSHETIDSPESVASAASPPSPLSAVNGRYGSQHEYDLDHMQLQPVPPDLHAHTDSEFGDYLRVINNNHTANDKLQRIDEYKARLQELTALSSPLTLFQDIDTLINNYMKLKKEYCLQWEVQQLYRQQIRSLVKQMSGKNGSVPNLDTSDHHLLYSSIPLHEVQSLITRLQRIETSVLQMFASTSSKQSSAPKPAKPLSPTPTPPRSKPTHHRQATMKVHYEHSGDARHSHHGHHRKHTHSHRHNMHHSRSITMKIQHVENTRNIRPSHAKQLSNGHMSDLTNISQTLMKEKHDRKRNGHRHEHKEHRHKTPKFSDHDPSVSITGTPKLRRTKSAADYDYNRIIAFKDEYLHEPSIPTKRVKLQIPLERDSEASTTSKYSKHSSKGQMEPVSRCTAPTSPEVTSKRRRHRDRRRSSVRSFGTVYSHQFRHHVAKNYRSSIRMHHDEKPRALQLSAASPSQLKLVQFYRNECIGHNELFESPFGIRPVLYCDWASSGKPLSCVEKYIKDEMLTLYANTHTVTSITGVQTSQYRSEARSIILESLNGDPDEDAVIFCGSSSTAAIYKMANVLMKSTDKSFRPESTIVFISVYEHNSNIYIWQELGCKVVVIGEHKKRGGIDLKTLEKQLKFYTCSPMKFKYTLLIGSFTAASNVSGIDNPVDRTTELLHKYGALAFWDYSTAGPYHRIKMTNAKNPVLSKDAIFLSMHQWLGGPGSPGILCAKKRLFQNYVPVVPGAGTLFVAYGVEDGEWEYLENIEEREEAGTPDIIGSVRACFAFMVKDHISTEFIKQRDRQSLDYFLKECKPINNLVIMGNTDCSRLPILSFLITHTKRGFGASQKTKYLHYNFIAALMNDLFGIQGRGGCGDAGMYGKHVLGISSKEVDHVTQQIRENQNELARPGYFRIHLHYTLTDEELEYIVNAVKYICLKGWLFVPLYEVDPETGNYAHRDMQRKPQIAQRYRSLLDVTFDKKKGEMFWTKKHLRINTRSLKGNFSRFFEMADEVIENIHKHLPSQDHEPFANEQGIQDDAAWYWLPSELYQDARNYAL